MPPAWSAVEIEATVAAYFEMLRLELAGQRYVKATFNERLRRTLDNRSKAAVEFKFQNISAVLVNHGQVYIGGYLPAQNYQLALESAVLEWLQGRDDLADVIDVSPVLNPLPPARVPSFSEILTAPPDPRRVARRSPTFVPVRIDFVRRDTENRALGMNGEEFVFELERQRLHDEARRPDLAKKVRWSSRDEGDGLGYDIRSFEHTGAERLIEVKTTGSGIYTQFAVTRNEVACSEECPERYHLYRVYDFGRSPRLYVLRGAFADSCTLTPTLFNATVGRAIHEPA